MKTLFTVTVIVVCGLFTQCAPLDSKQNIEEQEEVKSYRPLHEGNITQGRYQLYSYNLYDHSIEIAALNADIIEHYIEIFDTNHDSLYDSVWVCGREGIIEFKSMNKKIPLKHTLCSNRYDQYIGLGNFLRKKVHNQEKYPVHPLTEIFKEIERRELREMMRQIK